MPGTASGGTQVNLMRCGGRVPGTAGGGTQVN